LTHSANLGDLTSLEEFVVVTMNKKVLAKGVIDVLWQIFGTLLLLLLLFFLLLLSSLFILSR
jgi:hypothetical protein